MSGFSGATTGLIVGGGGMLTMGVNNGTKGVGDMRVSVFNGILGTRLLLLTSATRSVGLFLSSCLDGQLGASCDGWPQVAQG